MAHHSCKISLTLDSFFGADQIPLTTMDNLEQSIPEIIVYAAPFMFFFVLVEYIFSRMHNHDFYEKKESIGSVLVGIGNVAIGVFLKTILLYVFIIVYNAV